MTSSRDVSRPTFVRFTSEFRARRKIKGRVKAALFLYFFVREVDFFLPDAAEERFDAAPFLAVEAFFLPLPVDLLLDPEDFAEVFDFAVDRPEDLVDFVDDEPFFPPDFLEEADDAEAPAFFFVPPFEEDLALDLAVFLPAEPDDELFPPPPFEDDFALLPPLLLLPDLLPFPAPVASTAVLAAPTTAPEAAPESISPTTSVVLSTIFFNVLFFFAIRSPFSI